MNNTRQKRVLILDISARGHHPTYLRWLLESELAESSTMIVASRREMFEHPELADHQTKYARQEINIDASVASRLSDFSSIGLVKMSWLIGNIYRSAFAAASQIAPIDFVIVPFIDDCLLGLAAYKEAFSGVPWMAITMRTMFHYSRMGVIAPRQRFSALRRFLFYKLLKQPSLISMLTIDPTLATFAKTQTNRWMHKVDYLPDPAKHHATLPAKADVKRQLGIPIDSTLIVLYGEISVRKGTISLLEAAADQACPRRVHVLMAGRCPERNLISANEAFTRLTAEGRLHSIEGYLDDQQERQILAAADCMWIGYTGFYGMSGIMVLSARHSIPIVASKEGLIGYLASQHTIGLIVEPQNRLSVVAAFKRFATEPEFLAQAGRNAARLFDKHRPAELQRLVTEKARLALAT